jgi:hypothetical protein
MGKLQEAQLGKRVRFHGETGEFWRWSPLVVVLYKHILYCSYLLRSFYRHSQILGSSKDTKISAERQCGVRKARPVRHDLERLC